MLCSIAVIAVSTHGIVPLVPMRARDPEMPRPFVRQTVSPDAAVAATAFITTTTTTPDDPDRSFRWAAWQEKGRRSNLALQRRMRWCVSLAAAAFIGWVVWGLR